MFVGKPGVLNAQRRHCEKHGRRHRVRRDSSACSTPKGVTAKNTRKPAADVGRHFQCGVLNAQRRHCEKHRSDAQHAVTVANQECSTPKGVTAKNTRHLDTLCRRNTVLNAQRRHCEKHARSRGDWLGVGGVLNAQRRHCEKHVSDPRARILGKRCSTPKGVTAKNTRSWPRRLRTLCAQRPKASLRKTRVVAGSGSGVVACSTPKGVTAKNTAQRSSQSAG